MTQEEIKDGKFYYGGSLYLEGTAIASLPDNLTVGGSLDLRGTIDTSKVNRNIDEESFFSWRKNKYTCFCWKTRRLMSRRLGGRWHQWIIR